MAQTPTDIAHLQQWIGKSEILQDTIHPGAAVALAATLNHAHLPAAGQPLPPLWHWIYFWTTAPQNQIGDDGHPSRGGFLPPVQLPRRMWAGGRLRFTADLPIGAPASRTSRILDVTAKSGKSGDLAFVTIQHEITSGGVVCLTEEHDIVYRNAPLPGAVPPSPPMAPTTAAWERRIDPDPVLLFRYSALTFNGHRIHYDRSYVTEVEGYPGLIVHGPLIATLLVDLLLAQMPGVKLASFSFRAVSPLFDIDHFIVCGSPDADGKAVRLWAKNSRGQLAMQAEAILASTSTSFSAGASA